jgi:hypothetical protein
MRPSLTIILALATVSGPATAQSWTGINQTPDATYDTGPQLRRIDRQIDAGQRLGQLSGGEAHRLRRAGRAIDEMAARDAAGGVSRAEQDELDTRLDVLSHQVFYDRMTTSAAAGPPK